MPQIKITQHYSGRLTGEKLIEPGVYEVGDSRLFGLEDYLVNVQKKAFYLSPMGETKSAPEPIEPPSNETARLPEGIESYEELDFEILRALVAKRELTPVPTGKNDRVLKADLVKALEEADAQ